MSTVNFGTDKHPLIAKAVKGMKVKAFNHEDHTLSVDGEMFSRTNALGRRTCNGATVVKFIADDCRVLWVEMVTGNAYFD